MLKLKITPVQSYVLHLESGEVIRLYEDSSWEGMVKLKTTDGQTLIIEEPGNLAGSLSRIFGRPIDCLVHKVSPSLAAHFMQGIARSSAASTETTATPEVTK